MSDKDDIQPLTAEAAQTGRERAQTLHSKQEMEKPRRAREGSGTDLKAEVMEQQRPAHQYHSAPRGMLDRTLQAQLGRQLRAIFSDIAEEPVPERFIKLLDALEARERRN